MASRTLRFLCLPLLCMSTVSLAEDTEQSPIEETVVLGVRKANFTEITEDTQKLVDMPGSLGDPLGAITALPGVVTPAAGGPPAVRGSSPDDNRYYIDGMPAGYIFHQFNTSIFDENVIQDFQLFAAGFGAQYSQATGAIFDVRLRDPARQPLSTTVNLSLLRAGVFVESALSDSAAFYLSARVGLIQFFLPEDDEPDEDGIRIISAPEDSDYQFKTQWDLNDNHSLSLTLAGAQDFAEAEFTDLSDFVQKNPDYQGDAMINREFDSQGVNWLFQGDTGLQAGITLSHYADLEEVEWGDNYYLDLELDSLQGRAWISALVGDHTLTLGSEYSENDYHYSTRMILFVCTEFDVDCDEDRRELIGDARDIAIAESSVYLIDNWQITESVNLELGLQYAGNNYTDEYFTNPRAALTWDILPTLSLISSAGRYNRTPNVEYLLPTVGNPELGSPLADHYTFGFTGDINDRWNWSLEAYYKDLSELPLALDEDQPDTDQLYSNDVTGEVRGLELFINRNLTDRWYGWMSLSYSVSERTNTRSGETREYTFDTPIVFNLVGHYALTPKWDLGFRFTAKSGEATTEIIGVQENPNFPGRYLPVYGEAYADRLPTYTRLDIRAERELTLFGKDASFFIDVLNVLNADNISERQLDYEQVNATGELYTEDSAEMGTFGSVGIKVTF